jgi:hypothetical protein
MLGSERNLWNSNFPLAYPLELELVLVGLVLVLDGWVYGSWAVIDDTAVDHIPPVHHRLLFVIPLIINYFPSESKGTYQL